MAASWYCVIQSYVLVCIQSVAFQGAEVVFHMAAPNSSINNYQLHHSVNVEGTKNVIDACTELKHNDFYSATKAQGEELVIKANGVKGLLTCCIRPSSIFGPGDRLLVPSLVVAARAGKSKVSKLVILYTFVFLATVLIKSSVNNI
ncbi:hypothetical protein GBA52_028316 [Prunus armeniaca]|nr:hypothetical protein GBA52_028316 [Prunus armeniaca]